MTTHDEEADLRALRAGGGEVEVRLDALHLSLWGTPYTERRRRRRLRLSPALSMGALLLPSLVLGCLGQFTLAAFALTMTTLLAILSLISRADPRLHICLSAKQLHINKFSFYLEDIAEVRYHYFDKYNNITGLVELILVTGERHKVFVYDLGTGAALCCLLRRHVERRRGALSAEGHDVSRPASPPQDLLVLQDR